MTTHTFALAFLLFPGGVTVNNAYCGDVRSAAALDSALARPLAVAAVTAPRCLTAVGPFRCRLHCVACRLLCRCGDSTPLRSIGRGWRVSRATLSTLQLQSSHGRPSFSVAACCVGRRRLLRLLLLTVLAAVCACREHGFVNGSFLYGWTWRRT